VLGRPGATEAELDEQSCGATMAPALRALLRIHNGQAGSLRHTCVQHARMVCNPLLGFTCMSDAGTVQRPATCRRPC